MNTETQVDPSATTQTTADDQLQKLEIEVPETEANTDLDERSVESLEKQIRKKQRQIDSRNRGLGERDARIQALEAELSRTQGSRTAPQDQQTTDQRGYTEEEVERRASLKAEQTKFAETVSTSTKAMVAAGKAYDGFAELAAEVSEDLPFLDSKGRPTPFILALYDSGKPELAAEVMVHLARNPEVRDELIGLSERQMARRLALIEASISKKPEKRSAAPKPIANLSGNSRGDPDPETNTRAWIEARNKRLNTR